MAAGQGTVFSRDRLLLWLLQETCETKENTARRYSLQGTHEPIYYTGFVKLLQMVDQLLNDILNGQVFMFNEITNFRKFLTNFQSRSRLLILLADMNPPATQLAFMEKLAEEIATMITNDGPTIWQGQISHQAQ